jgi:UDPglucose 6-dehydrogenase
MKVSVIGTGYVGLVSGACLADIGHQIVCVDLDPRKVDMITSKTPPIYEKGLQELLDRNGSRPRPTCARRCSIRNCR